MRWHVSRVGGRHRIMHRGSEMKNVGVSLVPDDIPAALLGSGTKRGRSFIAGWQKEVVIQKAGLRNYKGNQGRSKPPPPPTEYPHQIPSQLPPLFTAARFSHFCCSTTISTPPPFPFPDQAFVTFIVKTWIQSAGDAF